MVLKTKAMVLKTNAMRTLQVRVKANARTSALAEQADGSYLASVKALPVDGKANAELIALIATHFGVRKSLVAVKSGAAARMKLVTVGAFD
jgi:uncharacterized protein